MFPDTVRVLLVGLSASNSSKLQDHLRRLGCRVSMRKSCRDAARTLQRDGYGLVLAEFLLSDGCAYDLVPVILATETSMFFHQCAGRRLLVDDRSLPGPNPSGGVRAVWNHGTGWRKNSPRQTRTRFWGRQHVQRIAALRVSKWKRRNDNATKQF
jgi:hypothetical protein